MNVRNEHQIAENAINNIVQTLDMVKNYMETRQLDRGQGILDERIKPEAMLPIIRQSIHAAKYLELYLKQRNKDFVLPPLVPNPPRNVAYSIRTSVSSPNMRGK